MSNTPGPRLGCGLVIVVCMAAMDFAGRNPIAADCPATREESTP